MDSAALPTSVPADVRAIAARVQAGIIAEARPAAERLLRERPTDCWVLYLTGIISLAEDRYPEAIRQFQEAARHAPERTGLALSWNGVGRSWLALGQYQRAAEAFRTALRIEPERIAHALDFAQALEGTGKLQLAEELLRDGMRGHPGDPAPATALAGIYTQHGRQAEALALLDTVLRKSPGYAPAHFNASTALVMLGRVEAAYEACRKALELDPALAHFYQLANLGPLDAGQIAMLRERAAENSGASVEMRVDAGFTLAAMHAQRGEYDAAFAQLERANRLKHATLSFDIERLVGSARVLRAFFTPALFARFAGKIHSDLKPIFIVGMPRSGSTLIEQMLAAHPEVGAGGELLYLPEVCRAAGDAWLTRPAGDPPSDGEVVADLTRASAEYARRSEPLWRAHARFTDKLLGNYQLLGMIELMFPQAAIIHVRRDPFDTCLSCYEHLFSSRMDFVYDLGDLGSQYRLYEELMAHWRAVLPAGRILDVDYESVVTQPEAQVRRVLEHCGLPFDAACLDFQAVHRPVTTASVVQVTRPLYRTSIGRWRHYRAHLEPLAEALGRRLPD
ncbi:MAG: tetratricopeptide repeat-containing sulfotransferase family protein [Gammaproteobacteria bacterium]